MLMYFLTLVAVAGGIGAIANPGWQGIGYALICCVALVCLTFGKEEE